MQINMTKLISCFIVQLYILPAVLLFQPELVKRALRYRSAMGSSAVANAESIGSQGYKYPYRSGYTGREVSKFNGLNFCPKYSF